MQVRITLHKAAASAALLCCLGLAQAQATKTTLQDGVLSVGSDLTYPPYAYLDKGQPAGFDVEFSQLLGRHAGLKPEFQDTRFADLVLGLRARRFDAVASALFVTPERARLVDYVPYLKTGSSFVVLEGSSHAPQQLAELCGKRIASIKGASWTPKLARFSAAQCKGAGDIKVLEFPTTPEALLALKSRAADLLIEDTAVAHGLAARAGSGLKVSSTTIIYPMVIGVGLHKDASALKAQLAKALEQARAAGEYQALLAKYGLQAPSDADMQDALAGTAK